VRGYDDDGEGDVDGDELWLWGVVVGVALGVAAPGDGLGGDAVVVWVACGGANVWYCTA
jgi:hypothetical protein